MRDRETWYRGRERYRHWGSSCLTSRSKYRAQGKLPDCVPGTLRGHHGRIWQTGGDPNHLLQMRRMELISPSVISFRFTSSGNSELSRFHGSDGTIIPMVFASFCGSFTVSVAKKTLQFTFPRIRGYDDQ